MRPLRSLATVPLVLAATAAPAGAQDPPARVETLAYATVTKTYVSTLWGARIDGTGRHKLATGGRNPRVSPDGTRVAFLKGPNVSDVYVVAASGGTPKRLVRNVRSYDVPWSPDGTTLAVVTGPETGTQTLRLVDAATGATRTLATGAFAGVSFAPDGSGVVWARAAKDSYPLRSDLYTAPLSGGPVRRLTTDGNALAPAWGPDRIAYSRGAKPARSNDYTKLNVFTILPDGTGRRQLTHVHPPFLLAGLTPIAWSADGRRLAADFGGQDTSELWRVDAVTGAAKDVTSRFDGVFGADISRDGTAMLATTGYIGEPSGDVVSVAWGTGKRTVLVKHATPPSWNR